MTSGISNSTAKWLTYLVYFLITLMGLVISFQSYQVSALQSRTDELQTQINLIPKEYVRQNRYACDIGRIETLLRDLNQKMDRAQEREIKRGENR